MNMTNKKIVLMLLIVLLTLGCLYLGFLLYNARQTIIQLKEQQMSVQTNKRVVTFMRMFARDVLNVDHEVDFETRLALENTVRSIGDPDILKQWNAFVNSETESQAQEEVKKLLGILVEKVE